MGSGVYNLILLVAVALAMNGCFPQTVIFLPPSDPLFCKQTLGEIDCYTVEEPFGINPGWLNE